MSDEVKKSETSKREEEVLAFWNEHKIFEKSLEKESPKGEFVFYDGPPFATGLPHHGHLLGSTSKDLFGRYRTMRGYHVRRRWGWDTHGLPIESLVEEKLGLKNKKDILEVGVEKFNSTARSIVLEYVNEWERYIERIGRWVDFKNSYKTFDPSYTESVWWALKEIHKKGYLYEGHKVLMYSPHEETVIAKAEVTMDNSYKDVTDETVTAKFRVLNPEKLDLDKPTFILAWTTTPWTLPGNVALAVGRDIDYAIVEKEEEYLILARDRVEENELSLNDAEVKKGSELLGLVYEPLYKITKAEEHSGKRWQVVPADFVTTEDGTGVVHTAVMYGEDDFELGKKENLPMVQLLNPDGTFNGGAPSFIQGAFYKKGGKLVTEDLESRGLIFTKAPYTHSYPHSPRSGTPLIYNAVPSWFINVQAIKDSLLKENEKINWVPGHLKEGRFKNIVEGAPDWTISRNRFWASPLPIWKDKNGTVRVIGSQEELKERTKKSGNTYTAMRHGEAEHNVERRMNSVDKDKFSLTEKGREDAQKAAKELLSQNISVIYASPYARTRESAELVADILGIDRAKIQFDDRLGELDFGEFNNKSVDEFIEWRNAHGFQEKVPGGESYQDAKNRFGAFLYDIEAQHENENILIVTHGIGLESLIIAAKGLDATASQEYVWDVHFNYSEVVDIPFVPLPHNKDYELDYHLPYIDRVQLEDENGEPLTRVPEVVDGWVESGAMPFAEYNYPFNNKQEFEKRTPGDFISEYIAQTRTWFYYMHVLSVHLFDHRSFNNVVTTGTILAADGEKMSKSKKNFTDPMALIDRFGSDALRYYLMSSVVMQAEDFNFKDEDLRDVHNKVVNIFRNTLAFFSLYKDKAPAATNTSEHVLDKWILMRLDTLTEEVTYHFDHFDTVRATRPMRDFVEDFSTWYVRRSRDRVKAGNEDSARALATLRYVLCEFSKIIAPVMPFIADEVYREIRADSDPVSVHLAEWPEEKKGILSKIFGGKKENSLLTDMREVREVVSLALEARQRAGIKVRQPLQKLTVNSAELLGKEDLLELIKEELNVKEVVVQTGDTERVVLDTDITPELKEEGEVRELMREIQDMRKKAGLSPHDTAVLIFAGDTMLLEKHWDTICKATGLVRFEKGEESYVKSA